MSNTSPPTLLVAAQRLQTGSAQARDWVTEVARSARTVAGEEQSLVEATRRSQNLGRKLAASATRRNCVGVFGPSQAGKSYLVSVLARTPGKTLMADFAGDLMGDLNGRRGRISGMDTRGGMTVVKAQVPMAEMLTYERQLTSMTGGRGSYHMEYSHYEEVPSHIQSKIIAAAKAEKGEAAEEEE